MTLLCAACGAVNPTNIATHYQGSYEWTTPWNFSCAIDLFHIQQHIIDYEGGVSS
jgi:hypothetical protein